MTRLRRLLTTLTMSFALLTGSLVSVSEPPVAHAAGAALYAGSNAYSTIANCESIVFGSPSPEYGIGTYAGFYADPETGQPGVNQTFYTEVHVAGLGNSCGGQRFSLEIALPAGVTLAVTGAAPVLCFAGSTPLSAAECAQTLQPSPFHAGALWMPSSDAAHAYSWPMPQGKTWTFRFPVKSTTIQTNATFTALVHALDGWDNPLLQPTAGLFVFNGATSSVLYPSPSTVFTNVANSAAFTTKSSAYIYKPSAQTGTGYFDISTSPTFSTILFTDSGPIPAGLQALLFWTDWVPAPMTSSFVVQPNTTYYFRVRYVPSGGGTITGATQSFTTPSNGNNVVGNGTAASCTPGAIAAAFNQYTQRVEFDCGAIPVTIALPDSYVTGGPLEIDGKGKVTLVAQPGHPMFTHDGGHMTLKGLTLTGATATGYCGGALQVSTGSVTLDHVTLKNNTAANGAGVCAYPGTSVDIYDSAIKGNTATDYGGGVWNDGTMALMRTEVSGNHSTSVNGGAGIVNDGIIDFRFGLIAENVSNVGGSTGGGIWNWSQGDMTLYTSTVSGNSAGTGAGVLNAGTAWIASVTIAANTATSAGAGGGLQSTNSIQLSNTLMAGNSPANCASSAGQRVFTSYGHNIDSGTSCGLGAVGDMAGVDPMIRPLTANGGGTRTHALRAASPAVDSGDSTYCSFYDQRGVSGPSIDILTRAIDGNNDGIAQCDIGAYELEQAPVFVGISPARLLETRPATGSTDPTTGLSSNALVTVDGESQNLGMLPANGVVQLRVTGRAGIPGDAIAVSLNVTATGASANGFLRVYPCGQAQPTASTLNYAAGSTVANGVVAGVGVDGKVCISTKSATNVVVDVNGYMPAASKYLTLSPFRMMETRPGQVTDDGIAQGTGPLTPGVARQLQVAGRGGVPAGATAVMLNVTVAGASANGFLTVYPCGSPTPPTANLNVSAGATVANAVFVAVPAGGLVCFVSNRAFDVIVDVVGAVPPGTTLTPLSPARLLDSRPGQPVPPDDGIDTRRAAGSTTQLQVTGRGGVSGSAKSIILNVSAVAPSSNGFVTAWPCDQARPTTSSLNYAAGVTRSNLVIVKVPTSGPSSGKVCLYTSGQTDLVADVLGQIT